MNESHKSTFRPRVVRFVALCLLIAAGSTHFYPRPDNSVPTNRSARRVPVPAQFDGKDYAEIEKEVRQLWGQLEAMMSVEQREQFNPPASEEQIQSLENLIGAKLPPDFRAYLKIHNGSKTYRNVLYQTPLSIERMKQQLSSMHGFLEFGLPVSKESDDTVSENLWRPGLVLFAEADSAGDAVDCSTGKIVSWDHDGWGFYKQDDNFTEYLRKAVKGSTQGGVSWGY